jgi:hypothetical protein
MSNPDIKLRKLSLLNFRGSRDLLDLNFDSENKSCAIFGYNAKGKSTFTQALEWFLLDRVSLLTGEGTSDDDIVNLTSSTGDETSVNIVFNKKELNSTRIYDKTRKRSRHTNNSSEFTSYLGLVNQDRIYLDQSTMIWFLSRSKGEKKDRIAKVVGYEEITKVKSVITSTLRYLERHPRYEDVQKRLSQNQGLLTKDIYGESVNDIPTMLNKSRELLKIFNIEDKIESKEELDKILEKVLRGMPDQKRAQERLNYENLKSALLGLNERKDYSIEIENNVKKYNDLVSDKENVSKLNMNELLRQGENILKSKSDMAECPLCYQKINRDELLKDIIKRYQKLTDIRDRLNLSNRELSQNVLKLKDIERGVSELLSTQSLNGISYNQDSIHKYIECLNKILLEIDTKIKVLQPIKIDLLPIKETIRDFGITMEDIKAKVIENIKSLTPTKEEEIKFGAYQKLIRGKNIVLENIAFQKEIEVFRDTIKDMRILDTKTLELQNSTMLRILDLLSQEVNKYFCMLNKDEGIKNVKLVLAGEEGIEFSLEFYKKTTSPPKIYLSESQLNSLGIAFFLAAVKKFNKVNRYFVLDDVLVSFDRNYRMRLLDILASEFSEYQILLFTHEEYWYEMIKRKFPSWVFKEVSWTIENGIRFLDSKEDLLDDIIDNNTKGEKVGNNLRIYLESLLKEICLEMEIPLPFRLGVENDKRTIGELFPALTSALNKHKCSAKDTKEYKELEMSAFVTNICSHHNPDSISAGDISEAIEKTKIFKKLFICPKGKIICRRIKIPGKDSISCECGCIQIDWKE